MEQFTKVKRWVNEYFDWLKNETIVEDVGEWIEESTPFLDRHNDAIQIYTKILEDGKIIMSDDGATLRELCFFSSNQKRQKLDIIKSYLKTYGVSIDNEELVTFANVENIYQKKHFFIQCILAINDILLPPEIKSINKEAYTKSVKSFFIEKNIYHVANIGIVGKSGISHNVDFIIPRKEKSPEKIITAINKPDVQHAKISTFNLIDIREGRDEVCEQMVLLNDEEREIKTSTLEIFSNYDIIPIKWSERNNPGFLDYIA